MAHQQDRPKRKRSHRVKRVKAAYVNTARVISSAWDFSIALGSHRYDDCSGQWVVDEHAAVNMPIGVVKQLAFALITRIAAHENEYGPVLVPEKLVPQVPNLEEVGRLGLGQAIVLHTELFYPFRARAEGGEAVDAALSRRLVSMTKGQAH